MIVEDETIVALDLQARLGALGYEPVAHVLNGADAIVAARDHRPDIVLMDIMIQGDVDGIDTAHAIYAELGIPTVFLSAFSDAVSLQRVKQGRAYGYLLKPFQERELAIALELALHTHRTERQLAMERALLAATLETIGDAVIATDAGGTVSFMNRQAEELLLWRRDEALGADIDGVVVLDPAPLEIAIPVTRRGEWHSAIRRDGSRVPVEVLRRPLPEGGAATLTVLRDVSAPYAYARGLVVARESAEALARERREILARVTHEFRTPLNSIIGLAGLIADGDDHPISHASLIGDAAQNLERLVNRMLDAAGRGDAGTVTTFELVAIVESAVAAHGDEARRRGVRLATQIDPAIPTHVDGDCDALVRTLDALISNAVRFTEEGSVEVIVRRTQSSTSDPSIRFDIRDTGIGIDGEHLSRVRAGFAQIEETATRTHGGTGIGLVVAQRGCSALGTQLDLRSRPGDGTIASFTVRFDETIAAPSLASRCTTASPQPPRGIAVADELVRRALSSWAAVLHIDLRLERVPRDEPHIRVRTTVGDIPLRLTYGDGRLADGELEEPLPVSQVVALLRGEPLATVTEHNPADRTAGGARDIPEWVAELEALRGAPADLAEALQRVPRERIAPELSELVFRMRLALRRGDAETAVRLLDEVVALVHSGSFQEEVE